MKIKRRRGLVSGREALKNTMLYYDKAMAASRLLLHPGSGLGVERPHAHCRSAAADQESAAMKKRFLLLPMFLLLLACVPKAAPSGEALPSRQVGASATPTILQESAPLPSAGAPQAGDNPAAGGGHTYFVSPQGNDAADGSRDHPWASPGYASRQLAPGDTLIILGGRYTLKEYDADILKPPSGREDAWVTIRGEAGHRPVLAGRDNLITAIDLAGAQYVRIENLEITHDDQAQGETAWFRDGIEILGAPAAHIVLTDLYIHHVDEFGINAQDVSDLRIENSRIEYAGFGALGGPAGEHGGWQNVTVRGCSLSWSGHYYHGGNGADRPYDRPDGFGIEASAGPVLIENTTAAHNYGDGLDSKAANTTIRRSIVANNTCDGVKLWGAGSRVENTLIYGRGDGNPERTPWAAVVIDHEGEPGASFALVNVTIDDALGGNYLMYVQYDHPDVPVELTLRNVIFSSRGPEAHIYLAPAVRLLADHNLFYFPQSARVLEHGGKQYDAAAIVSLGSGNIYGDPLFVRPAWGEEGDYHLRPQSPAIAAGSSEGAPAADLEGNPRPNPPAMGAYEP